eukprot:TRINITY_DN21715_c0_g1_i1.p1 TRINITY_DN21715_c0_g1~~TRINITY_DN21715_c0_g1_i1.p1  ORF type:complete len:245 (+),score=34.59 TRINITY_DN21715_c0_g1_i1:50-784(+)
MLSSCLFGDVLVEVLINLPPSHALRCRQVCTHWREAYDRSSRMRSQFILSSPYFKTAWIQWSVIRSATQLTHLILTNFKWNRRIIPATTALLTFIGTQCINLQVLHIAFHWRVAFSRFAFQKLRELVIHPLTPFSFYLFPPADKEIICPSLTHLCLLYSQQSSVTESILRQVQKNSPLLSQISFCNCRGKPNPPWNLFPALKVIHTSEDTLSLEDVRTLSETKIGVTFCRCNVTGSPPFISTSL